MDRLSSPKMLCRFMQANLSYANQEQRRLSRHNEFYWSPLKKPTMMDLVFATISLHLL